MNEKRLPPRLMVLIVVLKGEKVYKIPLESGIKLDHLKDFKKKKGGLMNKEPSLEPMESSIIREALYLLTPQLP